MIFKAGPKVLGRIQFNPSGPNRRPAARRRTIPGRYSFRAITWDSIPKPMAKPIVSAGLSIIK